MDKVFIVWHYVSQIKYMYLHSHTNSFDRLLPLPIYLLSQYLLPNDLPASCSVVTLCRLLFSSNSLLGG